MPAFNEEEAIAASLRSLLALDYPAEQARDRRRQRRLDRRHARARCERWPPGDGRVRVIDFPDNRGKRAAMAAGIRATDAEIVAFVDSDRVARARRAARARAGLRRPAGRRRSAGTPTCCNLRERWLTRMQAVRYFVAFSVVKAAESVFSAVTCCSGCFSAYRRDGDHAAPGVVGEPDASSARSRPSATTAR